MMGNPQEFDEEAKTENSSSYSSTQNTLPNKLQVVNVYTEITTVV
jgi:hypothetical protein